MCVKYNDADTSYYKGPCCETFTSRPGDCRGQPTAELTDVFCDFPFTPLLYITTFHFFIDRHHIFSKIYFRTLRTTGAASSNCRRRQPGSSSSLPSREGIFFTIVFRRSRLYKRRLIDALSAQSADGTCRILPIVSCCVVFLVWAIPAVDVIRRGAS